MLTPITPASAGELMRRPTISLVTQTLSPLSEDQQELRTTIDQCWEDARARFFAKTGKQLGSYADNKEGVLRAWQRKYDLDDDKGRQKYKAMFDILSKVLNGVEILGGFAAQAASQVFAPAGMCFNAVQFLIDAPRQIKKVYEAVRSLFEEIVDWLVKFRVFRRIDSKHKLPAELVKSTNDVLLCLVDICALAMEALDHKIITSLSAVFLKDDRGVSGQLQKFRDIVNKQAMLTGAITLEHTLQNESTGVTTLEHVLSSEKTTMEIKGMLDNSIATIQDSNTKLNVLYADNNDSKNARVNRLRIANIQDLLGITETTSTSYINELRKHQQKLLPGTIDVLESREEFQTWMKADQKTTSLLFLLGDANTGKTHILAALAEKLDYMRKHRTLDDPGITIAAYAFRQNEGSGDKAGLRGDTAIHTALKSMAVQVAMHSTSYAEALYRELRSLQDENKKLTELQDLWRTLKLVDFSAPRDSSLYLLLDGVDQLKSDVRDLTDIFQVRHESRSGVSRFKFHVLFAGRADTLRDFENSKNTLKVTDINEEVISVYVKEEMRRLELFQDDNKSSQEHREDIVKLLPSRVQGNFGAAEQKLSLISQALERDEHSEELQRILDEEVTTNAEEIGKGILSSVCATLSVEQVRQLSEILMWTIYGERYLSVKEMEAVIRLWRGKDSLEGLRRRIQKRFSGALNINSLDRIITYEYVEDAIRGFSYRTPKTEGQTSKISMQISIENANLNTVKKFFWDLNNAMSVGTFDFAAHTGVQDHKEVFFTQRQAQFTIVTRCLQALNQEAQESTSALIKYAVTFLEGHLRSLRRCMEFDDDDNDNELPTPDREEQSAEICRGLIDFLSGDTCIQQAWDAGGIDLMDCWIDCRNNIEYWFMRASTLSRLRPSERRWAEAALKRPGGFFRQMALKLAETWLTEARSNAQDLFYTVDAYLALEFAPPPPAPPPQFSPRGSRSSSASSRSTIANVRAYNNRYGSDDSIIHRLPSLMCNKETQTNEIDATVNQKSETTDSKSVIAEASTTGVVSIYAENPSQIEAPQATVPETQPVKDATIASRGDHGDESMRSPVKDGATSPVSSRSRSRRSSSSSSSVRLSLLDRVSRAKEWAFENLKMERSALTLTQIGRVLIDPHPHEAIEYFKEAKTLPDVTWRTDAYYASALASEDKLAEALAMMEGVLTHLKAALAASPSDESLRDQFHNVIDDHLGWCREAEQLDERINVLMDAIALDPLQCKYRLQLMKALISTDRLEEAESVLDNWIVYSAEVKEAISPAQHIFASIRDERFEMDTWIKVWPKITTDTLRKKAFDVFTEAIEIANTPSNLDIRALLADFYGTLVGSSRAVQDLRTARRNWEICVELVTDRDPGYDVIKAFENSSVLLSMSYFDQVRADLREMSEQALQDRIDICEELESQIRPFSRATFRRDRLCDTPILYVAASYLIADQMERAREILRDDVREAIDILSDDDPTNDYVGILTLARIFSVLGDRVMALSALSLADRELLRSRKETEAEKHLNNEAKEEDATATLNKTRSGKDYSRLQYGFASHQYPALSRSCGGCDRELVSFNNHRYPGMLEEMWWCKFCPDSDFCTKCLEKLKKNELDRYTCSPNHEFVLMKHLNYSDEDIKEEQVRIEYNLIENEAGTEWTREGGRFVDLPEWLDMIRDEWNLPKTELAEKKSVVSFERLYRDRYARTLREKSFEPPAL